MYAIYGNMDPINIPPMLAYIPAPWILWGMLFLSSVITVLIIVKQGHVETLSDLLPRMVKHAGRRKYSYMFVDKPCEKQT